MSSYSNRILEKRPEIENIFTEYGVVNLSLSASDETGNIPDVYIIENKDIDRHDCRVIVAIVRYSAFIKSPYCNEPMRAEDSFEVGMDLVTKLRSLLGCSIDVVDGRRIRDSYPKTFSQLNHDEKAD